MKFRKIVVVSILVGVISGGTSSAFGANPEGRTDSSGEGRSEGWATDNFELRVASLAQLVRTTRAKRQVLMARGTGVLAYPNWKLFNKNAPGLVVPMTLYFQVSDRQESSPKSAVADENPMPPQRSGIAPEQCVQELSKALYRGSQAMLWVRGALPLENQKVPSISLDVLEIDGCFEFEFRASDSQVSGSGR